MLADLHLHSGCSDGVLSPEELAQSLARSNIGLASLTDHDTCAGLAPFRAACAPLGIAVINGMEMSCAHEGRIIHLLAYGFEPAGKLLTLADHSRRLLLEMSRDLVRKMSPEFPQLGLEDYDSFEWQPSLGGWKGLHYLKERGVTSTLDEGMPLYAKYDCDYSSYPFPSVSAVCAAIRDAGGIPVLAHPGIWLSDHSAAQLGTQLDVLRAAGIGGIECYYPAHSRRMTAACLTYCSHHGLLVTSGSDFHGGFLTTRNGVDYSIGTLGTTVDRLRLGKLYRPAE